MGPITPTLCKAVRYGEPFLYITAAKIITGHVKLTSNMDEVVQLRQDIRDFAEVHGLVLTGKWEHFITDDRSGSMLNIAKWVAYRVECTSVTPTPGYDADGREVWEYP